MVEERKDEISACRKQILYLEAYSRRENLKFEGSSWITKIVRSTECNIEGGHERSLS